MGGLIKQYLWVLDLVTILLCSYFGAKLTNLYISQKISIDQPLSTPTMVVPTAVAELDKAHIPSATYDVIITRNIFDSTEAAATGILSETLVEDSTVPTGEAQKTSLGIKVMGVLVVGKGEDERSSATIVNGGTTDTYAVGTKDGFAPGTKLTKIKPDRIEFVHNGRLEFALLEEEPIASIFGPPPSETVTATLAAPSTPTQPGETVQKAGENKFVIDQKEIQNALSNVEQLYTEIRAVPNFAGGKVSGMKILSVKQSSIFDKLGLQRGDILERINGLELDVKKGFEVFNQLKSEKHLTLDLIRQGAKQTLEYDIR